MVCTEYYLRLLYFNSLLANDIVMCVLTLTCAIVSLPLVIVILGQYYPGLSHPFPNPRPIHASS